MSGKEEIEVSGAKGKTLRVRIATIGRLAQATGVSAKTIRFYEERGVLPPARRAANGYRQYDESDAQRLRIKRTAVGFLIGRAKRGVGLAGTGQSALYSCDRLIGAENGGN